MRVLVTGSAGFIGFHVARRLLSDGHEILGLDGLTPYYDVELKKSRHRLLASEPGFTPLIAMLEDREHIAGAVERFAPEIVVHLAAQAGVRHSISHPEAYLSANVVGTMQLLEALRAAPPRHFLLASTSSVYGGNMRMPFSETDRTDFPVSLYAASKRACEALTHSYAHLYRIPVTCFRFFTVYGPWGRPDMALFKFVSAIEAGDPIDVFGEGRMKRDFTYVSDLVEAVRRLIGAVPVAGSPVTVRDVVDSLSPVAPWRTVNVAHGEPVELTRFIETIERVVGRRAIRRMQPMQPGDVVGTWADSGLLRALVGELPTTALETGIKDFVDWHRQWTGKVA